MGVTRATMSHGVRWTTSRLESLITTASSTAKSSAEAVAIAAATARRTSAACIFPPSGAGAKPRAPYVGVTQESQGALKTHRPHNGLAFSCRERAARDHLKKLGSRARSGQLQCWVGRQSGK